MSSPTSNPAYGLWDVRDFVARDIPPREQLLAPWLLASSITMLFAKAGVGKSNFVLGMALALAKGEAFLGFSPSRKVRVLYVDGEMPEAELHRRLKAMVGGRLPEGMFVLSVAGAEDVFRLPPLNTKDGQDALTRIVDEVIPDVLILDNKSTLMGNQRENEAGSWDESQRWLIRLRASGLAVILLHHAGKNGLQRGSSAIEVSPDIIVELYEPDGAPPEDGSHFVLSFDKRRHLTAREAASKLVKLVMSDDSASWKWEQFKGTRKENPKRAEALALHQQGEGQREIARKLGVSPSTVNGWLKDD